MTRHGIALGLALALCALPAFAADRVSGSAENGYRRLSFTLDAAARVSASSTGGVLTISADRKLTLEPAAIAAAAPGLITSARADADGKTLRFALTEPVKLHVSQQGLKAVVDLAPASFTGAMPDLAVPAKPVPKPVDMAALPEIKLRAGGYSNFTRLVFDWSGTVPYTVFPGAGKIGIRFAAPARMDLSVITKFPPAWVKNASWRNEGGATLVEFQTDSDSGFHDFRDGSHVVLDILAPKTDAAAYTPPGMAAGQKPQVTKFAGLSKEQVKAVADAAAAAEAKKPQPARPQTPKPAETKQAQAKPAETKSADTKPDAAKPDAAKTETAAAPADTGPTATGQMTAHGAVLTFRNARNAAIFIRARTAWIVLENAPLPDAAQLRKQLGGFTIALEASSNPGLSILRLTLNADARIGSRADGANLRVVIGDDVGEAPTPIGLARNQADPRRTSLTTLLPSADKSFTVTDPASGDVLTLVPAGPGFGTLAQKNFADFAALPSAQGLVIAPYADDLTVGVAQSRVTIARPGGMALTPPQLPVAGSPAALAHANGGPSWLDLARWGQLNAGSFLATERALMHDIAAAPPPQINYQRLRLARFYLAQGFSAESLGMINRMQVADPALKGDAQLSTMRAVAAYQMGRYRDAHNELAGPAFDSDRHAAFWRGLTDAALENWKDAHAELSAADPVIARYAPVWQARAHLADAEAGLALSRLDLADAALARMPKDLAPDLALAQDLARARITAAEGRYDAATGAFRALEKSGNERIAVRATFYRTEAGLKAGAISARDGINALEKLRFRWRGDGLEMHTLRLLASLYFKGGDWRQGLKTLRVATQNFSGDAARIAQDDMRGAFVNLYLKGAADKLAPVDSLALFYDNIDLTPIGPDGDEMIRRMADRLIAADLLAPATSLLAYQVEKRLDGVAKAQVATRLAAVQLTDRKPDAAIASLRGSQITGLPDDVLHARRLLEARAFAALKQYDNALDLIAVDDGADAARLRADIYWESGNWAVAGQKLEALLAAHGAEPFTAAERADALRAAVAYSLAGDEKSLERLRAANDAQMKGTPDARLFAVLSQPLDLHGLAFRDAAAQIASVDTLKTFMQDFNKKFSGSKNS